MTAIGQSPFWGTLKYEFLMQARRKAVWISMAIVSLSVFTGTMTTWQALPTASRSQILGDWALTVQFLLPIVFGVLMADRLPRDFRLNVSELFQTLPASWKSHLAGKFLGSALATGVPIFLVYSVGAAYLVASERDLAVIPLALAVFATVILPGLLFIAAFSIACPAVIWVPLYQFLFVGYWFWGNWLSDGWGIPTLAGTHLMPIGENAAVALFGVFPNTIQFGTELTWVDATLSIGLLLACAFVALFAVHQYLKWVRARQ